jgi:hypothetical protein
MEIKINRNVDSVTRVFSTGAKASRPIDADSALSVFENSRALEARLEAIPDVRMGAVEHGRRLVGDPAYPPRETIQRIASLLAMEMAKQSTAVTD